MRNRNEKGITLLLGIVSLTFIIPMIGLAVDVGFLYVSKSKLQTAVDGAALAAARALSIGVDLPSQQTSAQNNAVNWFYANFPSGYVGTANTVLTAANVSVFNDPNNAQLRNVTVAATTQVNTFFMKWLGFGATTVGATGNASRRTVVAMLVLDRSGSMGTSCPDMISAAKLFAGQFAANSDYIGAVSFSSGSYLHSSPTQSFQSVLGYTNDAGSGTGELDKITCSGGTATPFAISFAYNQLYKMNLPGALNVLLIETDGLPNSLTQNFWDGTTAGVSSTSNCTDVAGKKKSAGGFATLASLQTWTNGLSLGSGSYFPDIPGGIIGDVYSDDPSQGTQFQVMEQYYVAHQSGTPNFTAPFLGSSDAPGCGFVTTQSGSSINDVAWAPIADVFGNQLNPATNPFASGVTMTGSHVVANSWSAYHAGVLNATDNAAYNARNNYGQAATVGIGPVTIFTIALGGNNGDQPDAVLLQRMANDPNGDQFNAVPKFNACSTEATCVSYPNQPQGILVYSTDHTQLSQAFLTISSQVLRLSK